MIQPEELLPVIRGALAIRGAGPLVTLAEKGSHVCSLQVPVDPNATIDDIAGTLMKCLAVYRQEKNATPRGIVLPGIGVVSAGWNYDDLGAATEDSLEEAFERVYGVQPAGRIPGRIALVTGGAQGFGEGIVRGMTGEDAFVIIADLNDEKARSLADEINTKAGRTVSLALKVDVSDEESFSRLFASVVRALGGLDLFISNAGVLKAGSVKTMTAADFDFVTRVNYTGFFLGVKHASPVMALSKKANPDYFSDIIQVNSKSGLAGSNKNAAYAGGKFGGIGLAQSFALELVEDNIKVNAVCPGNYFEGPLWSDPERGLFVQYLREGKVPGAKSVGDVKAYYESKVPMGRGCLPKDVCRAILYCVEQRYETGQALAVTGGQIMLH